MEHDEETAAAGVLLVTEACPPILSDMDNIS
jgi:hypothetical protein